MKKHLFAVGIVAVAILSAPSVSSARQKNYSVTIPKVLSYPVTSFTFSSSTWFSGLKSVKPADVRVRFDNPNWSASVTEVRWNEGGPGTYFKLACASNSAACLKQAGPTGTYSYVLMPDGSAAPSSEGQHALLWDVRPPGDLDQDVEEMAMPEPNSLPLLALGVVGLFFVARKKLISNLG